MVLARCAAVTFLFCFAAPQKDKETEATVPFAPAPKIDGKSADGEWSSAVAVPVSGGRVLLQHDGAKLYVAVITDSQQIVSLFVGTGDEARVLHASARLGEARYRRKDDAWPATREFDFRPPSAEFQAKEKWIANTIGLGGKGCIELAVELAAFGLDASDASKRPRIALTTMAPMSATGGVRWPAGLDDDTVNAQLLMGYTVPSVRFFTGRWARVTLGAKSESRPSRG
jgi:hypothetical protein